MEIIESWEDHNANVYAIMKYSKEERQKFNNKMCEAMWSNDGELNSFSGSVGFRIAEFNSVEDAQDFLLKGISEKDTSPDIWFAMLVVSSQKE